MENYIQVRVLGKGSFGSAWLVQRRSDKVHFVAKEVRLVGMKPAERVSAKNEIDVLRTLNHPNITRYVDHFEHQGSLFIVMEHANGGDIYTKIKERKGARFSEGEILHFFSQLCLALLHLHERHILHRDLKTQNVFLTTDGVVKLGDFGISTVLRNTFELKRTVCGTPYYFSPELCLNKPYNNKSDVWALGCILYELTTLTHAFDGNNMKTLVQKILKGVYPPIHSSYSANLSKLISTMLQIDPQRRPNVVQIIALPFIRESLSNLQRAVQVAHHDSASVRPLDARGCRVRTPQQEAIMRADELRKEEQAKASKLARERQLLRLQMGQKLQQEEIERNNRKKEVEAQVQEQRRVAERRAKAQALLQKQREEEWERNMREQAEEFKRKQRENERLAREKAEQDALREAFPYKNDNAHPQSGKQVDQPALSAAAAAELYRDMRRQAALNKQRMLEDMRAGPDRAEQVAVVTGANLQAPAKAGPNVLPGPLPVAQKQPQQQFKAPEKMTEKEAEEARRKVYWQMRLEAEENKRRALGLDVAADGTPPNQALSVSPKNAKAENKKSPSRQQQQQQSEVSAVYNPPLFVIAKKITVASAPEPDAAVKHGCETPDGETATPDTGCNGIKRKEEYNALQTVIDAALSQCEKPADVEDFNDESFPDADPSRIILDGKTLEIPNVQATDPLMHRIESLRLFLEGTLGESILMAAYRKMNDIASDDDEAMQRVSEMIPEEHHKFIPVIAQLIVCEDAFNRQLLR